MAGRSLALRCFPPDDEDFARHVGRVAVRARLASPEDLADLERRVRTVYSRARLAIQDPLAVPPGSDERVVYAYRDGDAIGEGGDPMPGVRSAS